MVVFNACFLVWGVNVPERHLRGLDLEWRTVAFVLGGQRVELFLEHHILTGLVVAINDDALHLVGMDVVHAVVRQYAVFHPTDFTWWVALQRRGAETSTPYHHLVDAFVHVLHVV
ncbi:hypothetical protein D3C78_1555810 [compost metagenome]